MGKLELPSKPNPCDHTDIGEALRGEKIAVEAHDIDRVRYGHGLGKHKKQFTTLKRDTYAVIDQRLRGLPSK
jgi:hypothetical protein